MISTTLIRSSHKVGISYWHFEWCTKCRYKMFRQEKYKNLAETILQEIAARHGMTIRELFVMPEHIHISIELPPRLSQSKALQFLKGGLSYRLFRENPNFRLRYPNRHFFSHGACANSTGYATIDVVDEYVRTQRDVHQQLLTAFTTGSLAL